MWEVIVDTANMVVTFTIYKIWQIQLMRFKNSPNTLATICINFNERETLMAKCSCTWLQAQRCSKLNDVPYLQTQKHVCGDKKVFLLLACSSANQRRGALQSDSARTNSTCRHIWLSFNSGEHHLKSSSCLQPGRAITRFLGTCQLSEALDEFIGFSFHLVVQVFS